MISEAERILAEAERMLAAAKRTVTRRGEANASAGRLDDRQVRAAHETMLLVRAHPDLIWSLFAMTHVVPVDWPHVRDALQAQVDAAQAASAAPIANNNSLPRNGLRKNASPAAVR